MQILSLVLACAFILAGTSLAGSVEGKLPGVGTFAYNGTSAAGAAQHAMLFTR